MKARIIRQADKSLRLILCSGKMKVISLEEAKAFLLTFNHKEHFTETLQTEFFKNNMETYTGVTLAYVNENEELVITDPSFLQDLFFEDQVNYLTAAEYGAKHGKKPGIIKKLCRAERIPGAVQKGTRWLVPSDAPYPADARVGSRIGNNNE